MNIVNKIKSYFSHSYRNRIRLILMIGCILAVSITSIALSYWGMRGIENNSLYNTKAVASLIGSRNDVALAFNNHSFTQKNLETLKHNQQISAACIYDTTGKLFAHYKSATSNITCSETDNWFSSGFKEEAYLSDSAIYVSKNIFSRDYGNTELHGKVSVYSSLDAINSYLIEQAITAILVAIVALLICYYFSCKLERIVSAPVMDVIKTAQTITKKDDYTIRAKNPYSDEIGKLIDYFNLILSERENRHQENSKNNQNYKEAYEDTNRMMKQLLSEFKVPYRSLITIADLFRNKRLGREVDNYSNYLGDLESDMDEYKDCIESTLSLTSLYERAVIAEKKVLRLFDVIKNEYQILPDLRSSFTIDTETPIEDLNVLVSDEAFIKMIKLSFSMVHLLLAANTKDIYSRVSLYEENKSTKFSIQFGYLDDNSTDNEDHKIANSAEDIITDIKNGNIIMEYGDDIFCHPSNCKLLNDIGMKPEEYNYLIDSIRYIAGANKVEVSETVRVHAITLHLDFSKSLHMGESTQIQNIYL